MEKVYSEFWIPHRFFDDIIDSDVHSYEYLLKLLAIKRGMSNFVTILTHKNIPVKYSTSGDWNYTDGEEIFISPHFKTRRDFDVTAGLVLHEASHILLSDFSYFDKLYQKIPSAFYVNAKALNMTRKQLLFLCKTICNVVEDRYIDDFVKNSAPGYGGYYTALYDKFFNDDITCNNLMCTNGRYSVPSLEAYLYRVITLPSQYSSNFALPNFKKIVDIIDIPNIKRLKTTKDRFYVGFKVIEAIFKEISPIVINDGFSFSRNLKLNDTKIFPADNDDGNSDSDDNLNIPSSLENFINRQRSNIIKLPVTITAKELASALTDQMDLLDASGAELVPVKTLSDDSIDAVFIKRIDENYVRSTLFKQNYTESGCILNRVIDDAIIAGKHIGKRLKVRDDINEIQLLYKKTGKLSRRTLHSAGYGNDAVFYQTETRGYSRLNLHISVDLSGSMSGKKWENTLFMLVSICYAATMVSNIDVSISFRSTVVNQNLRPYVFIGYDSRTDSLNKIKTIFSHIVPSGGTPEGLAFDVLFKKAGSQIISTTATNYFINISDGMPAFDGYSGEPACIHTKKQINMLRNQGVFVLSYFITGNINTFSSFRPAQQTSIIDDQTAMQQFKLMYGNDSQFIEPHNIAQITKTLCQLFLKKED